jgi:hypothetical protein
MRRVMMSGAVGEGNPGETWIETPSGRHYRFFACLPPPSSTFGTAALITADLHETPTRRRE